MGTSASRPPNSELQMSVSPLGGTVSRAFSEPAE